MTETNTDATTELEEKFIDLQYPWHCHNPGFQSFNQYPSLEALCESKGLKPEEVRDAIKNHGGNIIGFHIVQR